MGVDGVAGAKPYWELEDRPKAVQEWVSGRQRSSLLLVLLAPPDHRARLETLTHCLVRWLPLPWCHSLWAWGKQVLGSTPWIYDNIYCHKWGPVTGPVMVLQASDCTDCDFSTCLGLCWETTAECYLEDSTMLQLDFFFSCMWFRPVSLLTYQSRQYLRSHWWGSESQAGYTMGISLRSKVILHQRRRWLAGDDVNPRPTDDDSGVPAKGRFLHGSSAWTWPFKWRQREAPDVTDGVRGSPFDLVKPVGGAWDFVQGSRLTQPSQPKP